MDSLPIPDDLLVDIFLRLPSPADLVRAHAACVSFRRVVSDRSFLRRFRRLHAPPVLGLLDKRKIFHPAVLPHPSAAAASSAALAADFSFSFLSDPARDWVVQDIRDGRILLDRVPKDHIDGSIFTELVVCDPLHRRYLMLPPIPEDLAASLEDLFPLESQWPEAFLVPPGGNEEAADETSFKVIFMVQCKFKMFAFVFSSTTGQWRAGPSQKSGDFAVGWWRPTRRRYFNLNMRQYAYDCFYWVTHFFSYKDGMAHLKEEMKMLVLDATKLEFSIAETPPEAKDISILGITMVEAGEGRLGMFLLPHGSSNLTYTIRRYNGGSSSQWQTEKTISLASICSFRGSWGRCFLLYQWGSSDCLTLDIKTFQLEKVCTSSFPDPQLYSNFPPSLLSSPTISTVLK